jgi:hypothetical protein
MFPLMPNNEHNELTKDQKSQLLSVQLILLIIALVIIIFIKVVFHVPNLDMPAQDPVNIKAPITPGDPPYGY